MEISYWKSRWNKGHTGWHMEEVYPHLKTYWHRMNLDRGSTVLVPLCGKSRDLLWLAGRGHRVIGVEVSGIAIREFLEEAGLNWEECEKGAFTLFEAGNIRLWQGDFFDLEPTMLPTPDAIYDKAALIALPEERRAVYARLINRLCAPATRILLNSFEYEQDEMSGPPFAVFEEELERHFGGHFRLELLHEESLFDSLVKFRRRGLSSYLDEKVYLLHPE